MTMDRAEWIKVISALPKGLSVTEIAHRTGWSRDSATKRLRLYGYRTADGRHRAWSVEERLRHAKLPFNEVDWSMANADIARKYSVSRERVRQVRKYLHK